MAGPLDQDVLNGLPQFAVPGLRSSTNLPAAAVAPTVPPAPQPTIGTLIANLRQNGTFGAYGVRPVPAVAAAIPAQPVVTAATPAPAPAAPVAPPATAPTTSASGVPNNGAVSPTPGAGNPLPPELRGDTPLPAGNPNASTTSALAGLPSAPSASRGTPTAPGPAGNDDLDYSVPVITPQGTRYGASSLTAGGSLYQGGSPAAAGIRDPQAAINAGFAAQADRTQALVTQAMNYVNAGDNIFERATRARFINGLLGVTAGPNNVGQVQGQGQDSLNSALAGVQSAGIGAAANEYGAQLGFEGNTARIQGAQALQSQQVSSTPVVIGQRQVKNALGLPVMEPIYGLPTLNGQGQATGYRTVAGNGMVVTPTSPPEPANPAVGTTRTRASGATERWDGKTWAREGQ